jgi:cytochrome c peroxidase
MRLNAQIVASALIPFAAVVALAQMSSPSFDRTQGSPEQSRGAYQWNLPHGFPPPRVPADNPMTRQKVTLGWYLFYDMRLSANQTQSCASCHEQARAFTDGKPVAVGSTRQAHPRNAMSVVNVAYNSSLTWANPGMTRLEDQALGPMFGDHPVELGLAPDGLQLLTRLRAEPVYQRMMAAAYPDDADPFTLPNVTRAIASFERSIISGRSPYDQYHFDRDDSAVSDAAKRGETLFYSQPLSCFRCHGGFNFSGAIDFEGRRGETNPEDGEDGDGGFHNTGLYNVKGPFSYPAPNTGVYAITNRPADMGKFRAPTLRNIAVTAPYMHDGSIATLEDVLAHYAAGGRTIATGPNGGVGHDNPNKDPLVRGFPLSIEQRDDLIAFLNTLTDTALLHDPQFSDPWAQYGGRTVR